MKGTMKAVEWMKKKLRQRISRWMKSKLLWMENVDDDVGALHIIPLNTKEITLLKGF